MLHPTHLALNQPTPLRRLAGARRTTPSETRTLEAAYLVKPTSQQQEVSSVTTRRRPNPAADFLGPPITLMLGLAVLEISNRSSQRLASPSAIPIHLRGLALEVQDLAPTMRTPAVACLVTPIAIRPTRGSATINSNSQRQVLLVGLEPIPKIKTNPIPILLLAALARTTNRNRVASLAIILRRVPRVVCLAAHQRTSSSSSSLQGGSSVIITITTASRVAQLSLENPQARTQVCLETTTRPVRPTPGAAFSVLALPIMRTKASRTKAVACLGIATISNSNSQVDFSELRLLPAEAYSAVTTINSSLPAVRCSGLRLPTISSSSRSLEDCLGVSIITTQVF